MGAHVHWHTYSSAIAGKQLTGGRQPECNPDNPSIFMASEYPPDMMHWWLLRPRHHIKGTFHAVGDVTAWLAEQHRQMVAPSLSEEKLAELMPVAERVRYEEKALPAGIDAVWTYWLPGATLVTLAAIGCPNRDGDAPCPTDRQAARAGTR